MPDPAAEDVCQLIEAGEIRWAIELTRNLSPSHIYLDLIYLAADENPSENYLAFVLAAAEDRVGTIDEISFIDLARAFLITALAPLDDSHARAFQLHLRSIELTRALLEQDLREISFFKKTPGHELDAATEQRLLSLADSLSGWRIDGSAG
jgi:ATP-dependent DNA ligase